MPQVDCCGVARPRTETDYDPRAMMTAERNWAFP
jgi:hypothetical protein